MNVHIKLRAFSDFLVLYLPMENFPISLIGNRDSQIMNIQDVKPHFISLKKLI